MRKFGTYFFSVLFSIVLSLFAILFVLNSTILNGDKVKSWLENADTVNLLVENSVYLVGDLTGGDEFKIDLKDEDKADIGKRLVEPVGENLIAPQLVSVIDQTYSWLNTKPYADPQIVVDLSQNSEQVRDSILEILDDYSSKLTICEQSNGRSRCQSPNPSELRNEINKVYDEMSDPDNKDAIFVEKVFPTQDDSQESTDTFEQIHTVHTGLKTAMLWLLVLIFVFIGLVELVSTDRLYALKILSRFVLSAFALPVVLTLLVFMLLPDNFDIDLGKDFDASANSAAARIFTPLIREVAFGFAKAYLMLGIPLVLGSTAGVIFIHKKHAQAQKKSKK